MTDFFKLGVEFIDRIKIFPWLPSVMTGIIASAYLEKKGFLLYEVSLVFEDAIYDEFVGVVKTEGCYS